MDVVDEDNDRDKTVAAGVLSRMLHYASQDHARCLCLAITGKFSFRVLCGNG